MYVTERAVFKLVEGQGLELVEVAPGVMQELKRYCLVSAATPCLVFVPVQSSLLVWPWGPRDSAACCCS